MWRPGVSVFDFLGIEVEHLSPVHIPITTSLENVQIFLGDAMNLLGDYLYDIVSNPHDLALNGILDFTNASEPTYVSNVTFLWSDREGALRIRRIDFLELMPIQKEGWAYHTEESFANFAEFLVHHEVPRYRPQLHAILNQFIELVVSSNVSEPMITGYLADHPEILQLAFGADNLNPQIDLEWQYPSGKPNLKPDFMPEKMDGYADVLEFKLPRLKSGAVVGPDVRSHPSFEVDSALAQIDEYQDWCAQEINRRWLDSSKGIKVLKPHTYLVIGHSEEFSASDRQRLRGRRNATIFTYDEFIQMARMQLYRVR
jgi:hypothetical protein